jgi:hypothetical protein
MPLIIEARDPADLPPLPLQPADVAPERADFPVWHYVRGDWERYYTLKCDAAANPNPQPQNGQRGGWRVGRKT